VKEVIVRLFAFVVTTAIVALALGTGVATASAAEPFHGGSCQPISTTVTVCFEAWGVSQSDESGGFVDLAQRRFTEYTSGVVTFEQRDHSHHIVRFDASGNEQVSLDFFSVWSSPSGLSCSGRDQLVVVNGEVVHSVSEFSCRSV
jgi:hypothetical protein